MADNTERNDVQHFHNDTDEDTDGIESLRTPSDRLEQMHEDYQRFHTRVLHEVSTYPDVVDRVSEVIRSPSVQPQEIPEDQRRPATTMTNLAINEEMGQLRENGYNDNLRFEELFLESYARHERAMTIVEEAQNNRALFMQAVLHEIDYQVICIVHEPAVDQQNLLRQRQTTVLLIVVVYQ